MVEVPPNEQDWTRARDRFVADAEQTVDPATESSLTHGAPLGPLAQQFATLTYSLLEADTVATALQQVVQTACNVIDEAEVASVTLRSRDGTYHTPVQTEPVASELDQLQHRFREGPCLAATERAGPAMALSHDLGRDPQWPRFGPAAAERGMGSVLSTALLPQAQAPRQSGSLNVYCAHTGGLSGQDQFAVLLLATHASLALAHTDAVTQRRLEAEQLREAIASRDVIGQAKGILMGRRGHTAAQAFDTLRRTSQDLNVKLVQLAETLTDRHTALDPPERDTNAT